MGAYWRRGGRAMLISGKNLKLYFNNGYEQLENLPEIEKCEYGYNLHPGQKIYSLSYSSSSTSRGVIRTFNCEIVEVDEVSVKITNHESKEKPIEFAWSMGGRILEVTPCEHLYQKNKLKDILAGNIARETFHPMMDFGKGIWYKHGGCRTGSKYEENLQHFIKLGQATMF
jgi:hypothetical protein